MRKVLSKRDALLRLLSLMVAVSALANFPLAAVGQELHSAPPLPPTASFDSAIDRLNGALQDTANRLLIDGAARPPATSSTSLRPAEQMKKTVPIPPAEITVTPSQALARVERLRPVMQPILRSEGLPSNLMAVALVESGGRLAALSPKGARGLWQLMPETARRYGLVVSDQRDERLDPVLATRAAAHYLRDLYAQFGDWQLALAAYNAGESAVQAAIRQAGSNSFAVLSQFHLLPAETRMYVPEVLFASKAFDQLTNEDAGAARNRAYDSILFALVAPNSRLTVNGVGSSPSHP